MNCPPRATTRRRSRSVACTHLNSKDALIFFFFLTMEWSNETVLQFLAQYKAHSCIWDPRDPFYNKRNHVNDAWSDIKDSMGIPCTVKELKKKRESLMSAYRGYKCKIKNLEKLGAVYRPTWFAYQFMDGFLRSIYQYSGIRNNQVGK